jgi:hypothetical protein
MNSGFEDPIVASLLLYPGGVGIHKASQDVSWRQRIYSLQPW